MKIELYLYLLAVLVLLFFFAYQIAHGEEEKRNYHPLPIAVMAVEDPAHWHKMRTHVEVDGFVTYRVLETDGDLHIRICDSPKIEGMDRQHCIVAECIPLLPCAKPKVGSKVTVQGISRYDAENPGHHWWEVHPVEHLVIQ